jgi:hypothetical protein
MGWYAVGYGSAGVGDTQARAAEWRDALAKRVEALKAELAQAEAALASNDEARDSAGGSD